MKEGKIEDSRPSSTAASSKDAGVAPGKPVEVVDTELERRAVRKMDYTILPVMTMFYLLSFLVRTSLPRQNERNKKPIHLTFI